MAVNSLLNLCSEVNIGTLMFSSECPVCKPLSCSFFLCVLFLSIHLLFLCVFVCLCLPRRPVTAVQIASLWRRFWKITTRRWCRRNTMAGMWASLREDGLDVAHIRYPTSRTCTSWSASHPGSSPTWHPSASPRSASGASEFEPPVHASMLNFANANSLSPSPLKGH